MCSRLFKHTLTSLLIMYLFLYGNVGSMKFYLKKISIMVTLPNQPHLLNKYQINMGFPHFHEFGILSGMYILAPYQIDIVKRCGFCNGNIILIWSCFFLPTYHDFVRWKQQLYLIFYFLLLFVRELIIFFMLSVIHEILQNSNPFTYHTNQLK